jgi:hypothetical protein
LSFVLHAKYSAFRQLHLCITQLLFAAEFAVSAVDNDPLLHSAPKYLPDIWTSLQPKGSDSVPDHSFDWILHPISTSESAGTSLAFVLQARFPMHRPVMMCNERPTGPVSGSPAASMSQSDPNISSTPPVVDDDDDLKPLHEVSQQSLADLNPQKPPLYLRDLWDHVRATDDVARQEVRLFIFCLSSEPEFVCVTHCFVSQAALRGAAALIRRRPADLVDISLGLLDSLLAWSDSFHLPQFAGRQMNAIVELSTASPTQCTSRLIHRMYAFLLNFSIARHSALEFNVYLAQIWRRVFIGGSCIGDRGNRSHCTQSMQLCRSLEPQSECRVQYVNDCFRQTRFQDTKIR